MLRSYQVGLCTAVLVVMHSSAFAVNFGQDDFVGSFDTVLTFGAGVRTKNQDPSLILAGNQGGPAGLLSPNTGYGDQGDLNYGRGDVYTAYLKGSHELLLSVPSQQLKFMARANWVRDAAATRTTGNLSSSSLGVAGSDGFTAEARDAARFKARILDLWVSKNFSVDEHDIRVRAGKQVISWGESIFMSGGINAINALDLQRLSQPGTQIKEAILPAPMVSVAAGLGDGVNAEAYLQTGWNASYFAPVGSYWSSSHVLGKGATAYGGPTREPKKSGQWGGSVRYQPDGFPLNVGLYLLNYHDKTPGYSAAEQSFVYAQNRRLLGASANTQLGDWALGTELSYRPRDAVTVTGSCNNGGNCWVDEKRYQWYGTGILSITRDNGEGLLRFLRADGANLMLEAVAIDYPSLKKTYNNGQDLIQAGAWGWGFEPGGIGAPRAVGDKLSLAYTVDFNWTYDGSVIPGWQLTPDITFQQAVKGRSPNGLIMAGAKSVNVSVSLTQNPAVWQVGVNFSAFWGGGSIFDQPNRDRNFVGLYVSRNL